MELSKGTTLSTSKFGVVMCAQNPEISNRNVVLIPHACLLDNADDVQALVCLKYQINGCKIIAVHSYVMDLQLMKDGKGVDKIARTIAQRKATLLYNCSNAGFIHIELEEQMRRALQKFPNVKDAHVRTALYQIAENMDCIPIIICDSEEISEEATSWNIDTMTPAIFFKVAAAQGDMCRKQFLEMMQIEESTVPVLDPRELEAGKCTEIVSEPFKKLNLLFMELRKFTINPPPESERHKVERIVASLMDVLSQISAVIIAINDARIVRDYHLDEEIIYRKLQFRKTMKNHVRTTKKIIGNWSTSNLDGLSQSVEDFKKFCVKAVEDIIYNLDW